MSKQLSLENGQQEGVGDSNNPSKSQDWWWNMEENAGVLPYNHPSINENLWQEIEKLIEIEVNKLRKEGAENGAGPSREFNNDNRFNKYYDDTVWGLDRMEPNPWDYIPDTNSIIQSLQAEINDIDPSSRVFYPFDLEFPQLSSSVTEPLSNHRSYEEWLNLSVADLIEKLTDVTDRNIIADETAYFSYTGDSELSSDEYVESSDDYEESSDDETEYSKESGGSLYSSESSTYTSNGESSDESDEPSDVKSNSTVEFSFSPTASEESESER